jgi:hypothetical protein
MTAGNHTAIGSALYDIDVHLIAVALHKITPHVLFDDFPAAAIEILNDTAPVVVFPAAVLQHQVNNDGWDAALLLPNFSMVSAIHLHSSFQLVVANILRKACQD